MLLLKISELRQGQISLLNLHWKTIPVFGQTQIELDELPDSRIAQARCASILNFAPRR
jgi:hypothetical protein